MTLDITFPRRDERWEVVEVNWAAAFYPEAAFEVLAWGYHMLLEFPTIVPKMVREIFADDPPPRVDPAYSPLPKDAVSRLYDWIVGSALGGAWFLLYAVVLIVALGFFLLTLFPSWLLFPALAQRVVTGIVDVLVSGIGDMLGLMKNPGSLASVVNELSEAVQGFVVEHGQPANVIVMAHSGGATLAAYALSDPNFWVRTCGSPAPSMPVTLMTVGSSLNMAWLTGRWLGPSAATPLTDRALPTGVRWVDIYTRYDPVPHGIPYAGLVAALGRDVEVNAVRVVNHDSLFSDHGAYWGNYEEFVTRFVYEIMEQDAAALRLIDKRAIDAHRRKIGAINAVRLLVAAGVLGLLFRWREPANDFTGNALTTLSTAPLLGPLHDVLLWCAGNSQMLFAVNVAAVLVLLFAFWQLCRALLASVLYSPYQPPPVAL